MTEAKTKIRKKRRVHSKEFRQKALMLMAQNGAKAAIVAKNLGINSNLLYRWTSIARKKTPKALVSGKRAPMQAKRVTQSWLPVASDFELTELRRLNNQYKADIAALRHTIGLLTREG